ncbi:MAG: DUF2807 domain-containing protein [Thermomicrobiales bacterium]|nr:DUF2807 domain-containing protein [Thermomicrobiales bacterium]
MAVDETLNGLTAENTGAVTKNFLTSGAVTFELIGPGTASIVRGPEGTLSIAMPESEVEHIDVELSSDSLKVVHHGGLLRHREPDGPLRYEISIPVLSMLKLSHGLAAEAANIESREIDVELKDGSSLTFAQVRATSIAAVVSGVSRLTASGEAAKVKLKLADGSTYQGSGLNAAEVEIDASGGSEATVRVTKALKVKASGGSTVSYNGEKVDLNVQTSDGSELHRLTV